MSIRLRGHHLLCLLGYRGKGYSDGFCANMTAIYETLRRGSDTEIRIIEGPDEICRSFPADQPSHCLNASVFHKDRAILDKLALAPGDTVQWQEICDRVAAQVAPEDIAHLCRDCQWQPYGMCSEGVGHIRAARTLRKLPLHS
ncbi:DUF1284 domain-containing protein [Cohnella lubricantis]|uniref:DUF1284 domain-containing protein n=1 Tax=Cohnella lubricantis TaxID=2163172 RepID=A0A841TKM0_9BACL|nr:DUF1284 domain-containing protein [Cohnella lubricantis]MBB6679738.1 DUF1284 domain-containing protein [Cohnella lubricantis]MBP2120278.1 hypothetical protein [Cohnella lubricantis]